MRPWLLRRGVRVGPYYVGKCSARQHITILRSGKGTYCGWHRCNEAEQTLIAVAAWVALVVVGLAALSLLGWS